MHMSPLMRTLMASVESLQPPVVVFDLQTIKTEEQSIFEIMEQVHVQFPAIRKIALGYQTVTAQVISAMKSGACDFLDREAAPHEIKDAVTRQLQNSRSNYGERHGQVIALVSGRENDGENQIAVNLATHIARGCEAGEVLLVDLNLDSARMEIDLNLEVTYSIRDAIKELLRLEKTMLIDVLPKHESGVFLLSFLTEHAHDDEVSPQELASLLGVLRSFFSVIIVNAGCLRSRYCQPYLLPLCDQVLLITTQLIGTIKAAREIFKEELVGEHPNTKFGLLVSRYDEDITLTPEQISARLGLPLLGIIPRAWAALANGHNSGIPPVLSEPRSPYSRSIRMLAAKLLPDLAVEGSETKALPGITRLITGLRRSAV
jgi:pilus assembly protein CpaE